MIDYSKKITLDREFYPSSDINISIESDRGRILSSAAFRRLQKRTQVFALELNASIRTRLTHSLEVAQTARFISKTIFSKLSDDEIEKYKLKDLKDAFISTTEMTSLLHDIGNPPFGHFAEQTINKWIKNNVINMLDRFQTNSDELKELKSSLARDLCSFDGNAQAIRVISKLQRLNLSYTQILSVLKYTRCASEKKELNEEFDYLRKKPGYYYSEKDFIKTIQKTLEVEKSHRFPLTYIMEAADDISYLSADLEDSVEKGILSLDDVYKLIKKECEEQNEHYLLELIEDRYQKAKKDDEPYQFNMFFTLIRAKLVTSLVYHVSDIYISNHQAIFDGSFNYALLDFDQNSKYYKAVKILEKISFEHIYQNKEVQNLEMKGYTIINSLFGIYKPLLEIKSDDFFMLLKDEPIECFISQRLIKRISAKQIVAYKNDIEKLNKEDIHSYKLLEFYYRVRLIVDYISGMTDDFALNEYKSLMAI